MDLRTRIQEDMKSAMRARESERLGTIRMLLAAIKQREVDERRSLDEGELYAVTEKLIKQRKESAGQFAAAGRMDLAKQEEREAGWLSAYLPEPMNTAELDAIIEAALAATGVSSPRDMGKVIAAVRAQVQGRADMAEVAERIKARLA